MVLLKIRLNNKERKECGMLPPQLLGAQLSVSVALVVQLLSPTLCDPMNCSTPGFPVLHILPELAQTHVHWVGDAIQPSNHLILYHPLLLLPSVFPSIRVFSNESGALHQVAKVLELQLQYQSFQWIFRVDFLFSRAFSSTTIRKHQFFGTRSPLWSNS